MMKKVTCLLTMVAAMAIALPAMAQSPNNMAQSPNNVVGGSSTNQAQVPQPPDNSVNWTGVGIGAGTVAGNILYVPAKVVYGILGGITGGASYLLTGGNTQTANTIWRSSLGGDYVLTPDMVAGQKPIHFSGPTTTPAEPAPSTSMAAPAGSSAMNSTPMQSAPSARTASAANIGGGVNSSPIPGDSTTGSAMPQAADRGTGPVSSGKGTNSGVAVPPLPGTSIE
ncbi:MAG TPA: hypothetical protein VNF49_04955 [Candidatus Binataceae bacterium]|nr:hypothetical protein [Candidatus Binataceae bacterium]